MALLLPTGSPMPLSDCAAQIALELQQSAPAIDIEGSFPTVEFQLLGEVGLLKSRVAQLDGVELLRTLWHIGRGNLAVGRLYEGHINALQLVSWFGDPVQRSRFFADADAGHLFAVWNTEAGDGVTIEATESGWQLGGSKTFCSGAGHVTRPIVTGILDGRWQMTCLDAETASLQIDPSWWQPLGMRASASFKTDFTGTLLQKVNLLGSADDYYRQPAFSGGAIRFCAVQLGGAAALLDETRRFLLKTDRAENAFQQARIGQMSMAVQSGWQWLRSAGEMWDELNLSAEISEAEISEAQAKRMVAFAAMMRVATGQICTTVMQLAQESVGARGLMRGEPFERIIRDLTTYLKQPHFDEIPGRAGRFALESDLAAHKLWESSQPVL